MPTQNRIDPIHFSSSRKPPPSPEFGTIFIPAKIKSLQSAILLDMRAPVTTTPHNQRAAHGRRGRSLRNNLLLQKIFVQIDEKTSVKNFTKPLDKRTVMCYNTVTKKRER